VGILKRLEFNLSEITLQEIHFPCFPFISRPPASRSSPHRHRVWRDIPNIAQFSSFLILFVTTFEDTSVAEMGLYDFRETRRMGNPHMQIMCRHKAGRLCSIFPRQKADINRFLFSLTILTKAVKIHQSSY
jgi:hypothetical protein